MSSPIIFFGNERLATGLETTEPIVLQQLIDHGFTVAAIIARYTPGRSRSNRPLEIEAAAQRHGIPVLKPTTAKELGKLIGAQETVLGVLVAFGMIVPPEVIAAFPAGILNLHPSLLPCYRGSTPIEQAILDGAAKTGVSIMQLDRKMDAGPVLAQQAITLTGKENKADLARRLQQIGAELMAKEVAKVLQQTDRPHAQNEELATYCAPLTKDDGVIDWRQPAVRIEREIRAYLGWPGSCTKLWELELTVTKARVITIDTITPEQLRLRTPGTILEDHAHRLLVVTGEEVLEITELKPAGKRAMAAADFLRGRR
jgi:methionyl-tRNA formyltransferase